MKPFDEREERLLRFQLPLQRDLRVAEKVEDGLDGRVFQGGQSTFPLGHGDMTGTHKKLVRFFRRESKTLSQDEDLLPGRFPLSLFQADEVAGGDGAEEPGMLGQVVHGKPPGQPVALQEIRKSGFLLGGHTRILAANLLKIQLRLRQQKIVDKGIKQA